MSIRFQRRLRILPGLRLNLSKSGVSTSIGVRGAHVTLGHGQRRVTVGAPGTGLSYTTVSRLHGAARSSGGAFTICMLLLLMLYVFTHGNR